jgi:menaquinone-specific isochorismate synthase
VKELKAAKDRLAEALERHFRARERPGGLTRVEVPAPAVDLPRWLAANPGTARLFWSDRGGALALAGVGAAAATGLAAAAAERGRPRHPRIRAFGGRSFDGTAAQGADWKAFGAERFVVPRFEVSCEEEAWRLACTFSDDAAEAPAQQLRRLLDELARLRTGLAALAPPPPLAARADHPDRAGWLRGVEGVLDGIGGGAFQKVVLARQSVFRFGAPLDPFLLLHRLREENPLAFHFAFQPAGGATFLGASPERLYRRRRRRIVTEAVAGTRRCGDSAREDQAICDALLDSDKDRREHRFVADTIAARLADLCVAHRADPRVTVLRLARLRHLHQRFEGALRPGCDDGAVLAALHPTPAVAGNPTASALAEIARREPFHRGWYAGPIGWVGSQAAEFAVGIRSGLVAGDRLLLFVGAGIVAGSRPIAEWEELENKLAGFVRVIGAP